MGVGVNGQGAHFLAQAKIFWRTRPRGGKTMLAFGFAPPRGQGLAALAPGALIQVEEL